MKTGRPNLEFGADKQPRGKSDMRLCPVGFYYQLAALGPSREVEASTSTSRLVKPLTPPPQRNQFSVYEGMFISKFQRLSQNKTTRFLARAPGRLDVCRWSKTYRYSHIFVLTSSSISCSRLSIPVRQNGLGSALFRRNPRGGIRLASA